MATTPKEFVDAFADWLDTEMEQFQGFDYLKTLEALSAELEARLKFAREDLKQALEDADKIVIMPAPPEPKN